MPRINPRTVKVVKMSQTWSVLKKGSERQSTFGEFANLYAISLLPSIAVGLSDDPSKIIANPSTMFMP